MGLTLVLIIAHVVCLAQHPDQGGAARQPPPIAQVKFPSGQRRAVDTLLISFTVNNRLFSPSGPARIESKCVAGPSYLIPAQDSKYRLDGDHLIVTCLIRRHPDQ